MNLTPNFELSEFLCKGVDCHVQYDNGPGVIYIQSGMSYEDLDSLYQLANRLQVLRDFYQRPITINSGFRTWDHNELVGGSKESFHLKGMAADIVVKGVPAHIVYLDWESKWSGGLGKYRTFTHFDIRPEKARWNG